MFACRWLADPDATAGMPRPDRTHYVIDMMLDKVRIAENGKEPVDLDALQIWIDPAFPQAAHAPELRAYMLRMAEQHGYVSLLRYSNRVSTAVFPPCLCADREWHEVTSECSEGFGLWSRLDPGLRPPA
jgi:hypothetical protein